MPFIPENELEKALVRAVQDRTAVPDFYRLLLNSDLLVLGTVEGQDDGSEKFSLEPGGQLNLVTGQKDGKPYLPVFSSVARMQDYVKQEAKYLRVNGRALLDVTRGAPITLNPASEYGKELTAGQVRQLLELPREPVMIPSEGEYPHALVEALGAFFATRPETATAWVTHATNDARNEAPQPLIGIEITGTESDWLSLMQALQTTAQTVLPGVLFAVQRVERHNPLGLANVLLGTDPFYQRRGLN